MLNDITERNVADTYGYRLTPDKDPVTILGFTDDLVIIGRDSAVANVLMTMVINNLQEIGLKINSMKSKAIVIENEQLTSDVIHTTFGSIDSITSDQKIKYLGVTFNQALVFDEQNIMDKLRNNLDSLSTTHLLQPHQKFVINQFIRPALTYPLQTAHVSKIPKQFLSKTDNMIRSAVKQILQLPSDTPNSMLYTSHKYKCLSVLRVSWEAYLQQLNINNSLEYSCDTHVNIIRDFRNIENRCLNELKLDQSMKNLNVRQIRQHLKENEYNEWCSYPHKGKGV
ncbi:hypothetical protein ANN_09764 [Periplaneta americana]|uniref:Reverse transcriptase domain-containing protein n=1 Tax=Periplaneta americana TaxID=6978 RepID=A0ABQ8TNP1_PERAM|nr:hypothetical protein ANN_09764 [Periplaneta americana]